MGSNRSTSQSDVLIVGGGPAGLATALALRKRGASVTVVDARTPPIDKACGEGLMPDSLKDLARLGVELTNADGADIRGIRFVKQSAPRGLGDIATASFPACSWLRSSGLRPAGLGVKRTTLHRRMVAAALEAGVDLRWGAAVQLKGNSTHKEISVAGETLRPGWLVGADGQSSSVRRWAGLERCFEMSRRYGFRQHFQVTPWSEFVEVHWARSGQAYVTPISTNEVCVAGVARNPHCRVGSLLDELPALKNQLQNAMPIDSERGSLTTSRRFERVATERIALVGDASGSADAITGEGLGIGFRQAAVLAECIEAGDLQRYNRLHPQTLKLARSMSRILLWMDRSETLRNRAIHMLSSRPEIFTKLLGVHLGTESVQGFALANGFEVALRLAWPDSPNSLILRSGLTAD